MITTAEDVSNAPIGPIPVRGPLTEWVRRAFAGGSLPEPPQDGEGDPLVDDDLHLALHVLEDLEYRTPAGVDPGLVARRDVVAFRDHLRERFWDAVVADAEERDAGRWAAIATSRSPVDAVDGMLDAFDGPSLSSYVADVGDLDQFRELLVHRSAYQLREADSHTRAIARLVPGHRKAAVVEIQFDEYGSGRPGASHAELFAHAMAAAGLDHRYAAHRDRLPGATLATVNLLDLFASRSDLVGQLIGHLALFEMTSVVPMGRYARAIDRLGMPAAARHFYDIHVVADEHHGSLARTALLGDDPSAGGLDPEALVQGAHTLLLAEDRFARSVLGAWDRGSTSLVDGGS